MDLPVGISTLQRSLDWCAALRHSGMRADYDFRRRPADARLHLCKGCSRGQCVLRVKIAGNRGLQHRLREADHNNRSGPNDSKPCQV
jgi:hypothetical protein